MSGVLCSHGNSVLSWGKYVQSEYCDALPTGLSEYSKVFKKRCSDTSL